jgi:hypothetical protein
MMRLYNEENVLGGGREIKASCRPKKEKNLFVTKTDPLTCVHTLH